MNWCAGTGHTAGLNNTSPLLALLLLLHPNGATGHGPMLAVSQGWTGVARGLGRMHASKPWVRGCGFG